MFGCLNKNKCTHHLHEMAGGIAAAQPGSAGVQATCKESDAR
jgi:hypothetical protein